MCRLQVQILSGTFNPEVEGSNPSGRVEKMVEYKKERNEEVINIALGLRKDAYRFAYWLTGNKYDAEDVLHNAYLNVLKKSEEIDLSRNFKSWFLTSILNYSRHTNRKTRRNYLSLDEGTIQRNIQNPLETLVSGED